MRAVPALGSVLLLAMACSSSSTPAMCTEDADCSGTQQCHPTARICVIRCHEGKDECQTGEICDPATSLCTCNPAGPGGSGAAVCAEGKTCHPEDRICVPFQEEGCGNSCTMGRICCEVGGGSLCVASPLHCSGACSQDADCDPQDRCDQTKQPPQCVQR